MLTDDTKQEIRDKLAAISAAMPGFRSRPAQRLMIAEVANALARCPDEGEPSPGSAVIVVQGGTGTGKSLAYGLTGMVMAKRKKKKLVISSSTIALQEQLMMRDLPFFMKAGQIDGKVELAKGRTRYLCPYRLDQVLGQRQQLNMFGGDDAIGDEVRTAEARPLLQVMADDFRTGRWDGDRDTRPAVADEIWSLVTTDRHGCLNRTCPSFKNCAQMQARKRLKDADVVVANHDLLLADLAMGGGVILPSPADTFYIVDEAHSLPEKAISSFASSHLVNADRRAVERLANLAGPLEEALGDAARATIEQLHDDAEGLRADLADAHGFFLSLAQLRPTAECARPTLEFANSCLPEEFFSIGANIQQLANGLKALLDTCLDELEERLTAEPGLRATTEKLMADLGAHRGRLDTLHATWSLFLAEPAADAPPVAKWIETTRVKNAIDFRINASPVVAADYLRSLFWEKAAGVVLTSATITALGSFDDYLRRTGLNAYQVGCVHLPSPFDYARQGTIEIPRMPSPKQYDAHTQALTALLVSRLETQGAEGTLVLFTSRRQMEDVAGQIPPQLRSRTLLQGTQSKAAILEAHRTQIDAGEPSVIFGLSSFTEGVDLPGQYCTLVVITKLPFAVPDTPVLRTLSRWVEERGGNSFAEISVPDAARRLEQSVGRAIRTETDQATVVVTDPRLWESRFGRAMLRGLPPFRIVAMGKEVRP